MASSSSEPTKQFSKSLGSLLKYMEGIEIIVELKTGQRHRGILLTADEYMNLTLENVEESSRSQVVSSKQDYSSIDASISRLTTTSTDITRATTTTNTTVSTAVARAAKDLSWSTSTDTVTSTDRTMTREQVAGMTIYSCLDIRGPTIRYIQFPDNADVTTLVKTGVDRERMAARKYKRGIRK